MNFTLIPLLSTLKKKEWKSLSKFILMQHIEDSQIYQLFQYLESNKDKLDGLKEVEEWRGIAFPESSNKSFTKLISKLFLITEDWLVYHSTIENSLKKDLILNKLYNNRGLYNLADGKASKIKLKIDKYSKLSEEKLNFKLQLLHQQCYSDNPIKYRKGSTIQKDLFQQHLINQKIRSLIYLCEARNWGNIKNADFSEEVSILESTIKLLPDCELSEFLMQLQILIQDDHLETFLNLRSALYQEEFERGSEIHVITTIYLINCCTKLWRKAVYMDAEENARLIEYGLTSGVLFSSGKIPLVRFYNLISTLGKFKSFEWNKEFIERWIGKVETKSEDSLLALAQALNAFNFHRYELISPLLRGIEYENFVQKIRALELELISLYVERETNYGVLRVFITNYKRTLKRANEKISAYNLKAHTNFLKVIELLIQKDFRRLTIKMEKYDNIAYRTWITEEVGKRQSTA